MKFDSQLVAVRKRSTSFYVVEAEYWDRSSCHARLPLARTPNGNEHEVCFADASSMHWFWNNLIACFRLRLVFCGQPTRGLLVCCAPQSLEKAQGQEVLLLHRYRNDQTVTSEECNVAYSVYLTNVYQLVRSEVG